MANPFVFEELAVGENFCGRRVEINKIKRLVSDKKNVLLFSRRRYGKSSLVKELFESHLPDKDYITVYVDLYEILNEKDFARLFYTAAANAMRFSAKTAIKNLFKYFKRVNFSFTLGEDGSPSLSPTLAGRDFDELLQDAFGGLAQYAKDKKVKVVVAFDEFQQVALISEKRIDATIRKYVQKSDGLCYIFSGSKRHILTQLFSDYGSPLYNMATGIELKGIDPDAFYKFCNERLKGRLSREAFDVLYQQADGESELIQQAAYYLYYQSKKRLNESDVEAALLKIVKAYDGSCRLLFDGLTRPQKIALKAIAIFRGEGMFSKDSLAELDTTKQSLLSALKALMKRETVSKESARYVINDRKLELWCRYLYTGRIA